MLTSSLLCTLSTKRVLAASGKVDLLIKATALCFASTKRWLSAITLFTSASVKPVPWPASGAPCLASASVNCTMAVSSSSAVTDAASWGFDFLSASSRRISCSFMTLPWLWASLNDTIRPPAPGTMIKSTELTLRNFFAVRLPFLPEAVPSTSILKPNRSCILLSTASRNLVA